MVSVTILGLGRRHRLRGRMRRWSRLGPGQRGEQSKQERDDPLHVCLLVPRAVVTGVTLGNATIAVVAIARTVVYAMVGEVRPVPIFKRNLHHNIGHVQSGFHPPVAGPEGTAGQTEDQ
jgi:hypothetical protein